MLFTLTSLAVLLGMAVSLWLAAYLLARGFNSPITLRAVARNRLEMEAGAGA